MADGEVQEPLRPLNIQVKTPGDPVELAARMARNDARDLPEAVSYKSCIIVGSGPSARHEGLWSFLRAYPDSVTVACNGALKLFIEHGLTPTYWACCDPQEGEVLNFLPEVPPHETVYLLATKCPESLFDKLANHTVCKWRLDDTISAPGKFHVTCAVSITLAVQNLMRSAGYNRFETYGWDCCFLDDRHHATDQPSPEGRLTYTLQDGTPEEPGPIIAEFETCPQWLAEIKDANIQTHNYKALGYEIVVHGPGAVGALLRAKRLIA